MSAGPSHLVQILPPKETGTGRPVDEDWFGGFLKELTRKFGGATSLMRSPGQGPWQSGSATETESVAVVEFMAERLGADYWRAPRERLECELWQDEVVICAQEFRRL
jgi:hypothetical protein